MSRFFNKIFYWFLFIPFCIIIIVFALNNRQYIPIDLWPFYFTLEIPLYLAVFISFLIGGVIGYFIHVIVAYKKSYRVNHNVEGPKQITQPKPLLLSKQTSQ